MATKKTKIDIEDVDDAIIDDVILSNDEEVVETLDIENRTVYPTGFRNIDTDLGFKIYDENTDELIRTNRGVLSGSFVTFIGNPHTGKSTLLWQMLGNILRPFVQKGDARVKAHIMDIESGANISRIKFLTNLLDNDIKRHMIWNVDKTTDRLTEIIKEDIATKKKLQPDKVMGSEGIMADVYYPTFIVVDALSELIPRKMQESKEELGPTMYLHMYGEFDKMFKKYKLYFAKYNINLLAVMHTSKNPNIGGPSYMQPVKEWKGLPNDLKITGSKIAQYSTDIGIYLHKNAMISRENIDKNGGSFLQAENIVEARIYKNRQGMDNITFYLVHDYEMGFNPLKSFLYECVKTDVIKAAGSVRKIVGYPNNIRSQDIIPKFLNDEEVRKAIMIGYDDVKKNILESAKRTKAQRDSINNTLSLLYEEY